MIVKRIEVVKYSVSCDSCGATYEANADAPVSAYWEAEEHGWEEFWNKKDHCWNHKCPECLKKEETVNETNEDGECI